MRYIIQTLLVSSNDIDLVLTNIVRVNSPFIFALFQEKPAASGISNTQYSRFYHIQTVMLMVLKLRFRGVSFVGEKENGKGLDMCLPLRRNLKELDACPLRPVDSHCGREIKQITIRSILMFPLEI